MATIRLRKPICNTGNVMADGFIFTEAIRVLLLVRIFDSI